MALTPTTTPIGKLLGAVTLPPTASPGSGYNPAQYRQAIDVWTRKAQISIKQIAETLTVLDTSLIPQPGGGGGGLYWSQALFDAAFAAKTTDNLTQGITNLYWTTALFNSAFAAAFATAFSAETTDSLAQGITNLYWSQSLFNTAFAAKTTDNLAQGATNLYFTSALARAAVSASAPLSYNSSTGVFSIPQASGSQNGFLASADWTTFNTGATTAAAALPAKKQTKSVVLCSAYTPTATGPDFAEVEVPYDTTGSSLTFAIERILLRVQTAGGAPSMKVEQSSGTGPFSATTVGTVTLAGGANEGQVTASLGTITSGTKLRFNVLVLGTAQNWIVQVDIAAN